MSNGRRVTCFGCPHVAKQKIAMGGCVAYCKQTGAVVPQHFQSDPPQITYWRVPLNCPLPDTEAIKSAEKVHQRLWMVETLGKQS